MPDDKKARGKVAKDEAEQSSDQDKVAPQAAEGGGGAASEQPESPQAPLPGQVTLSRAQVERLRRKLKARFH